MALLPSAGWLAAASSAAAPADPAADPWWSGAARCLREPWRRCPSESDRPPRGRSLLGLALLTGSFFALELAAEPPADPRWSDVPGFDDAARDALRGGSRGARSAAATASDAIWGSLAVGLVADWIWLDRRGDYPLAESALVDTSWLLGNEIASRVAKVATGRERPYVRRCAVDRGYVSNCNDGREDDASFWSGHSSGSATLAGLLCARHLARAERGGADWAVCGLAAAASVATGFMRVSADQHYLTDVLAGWGAGALFGYALPRVFDYHGEAGAFSRVSAAPIAGPEAFGLELSLRW